MSSSSNTSISQARKAVEQLKMEACMDRVKVSNAPPPPLPSAHTVRWFASALPLCPPRSGVRGQVTPGVRGLQVYAGSSGLCLAPLSCQYTRKSSDGALAGGTEQACQTRGRQEGEREKHQ